MRTVVPLITVLGALVVLVAAPSRSAVTVPAAAPGPNPTDAHPPPLQSRDMMRHAGGVLWWVGRGCRLQRVTMSTLAAAGAQTRECRAWPSPDGTVVLAQGRPAGSRPVVALSGASMQRLQKTPVTGDVPAVAWTPDSRFAAVCAARGHHGVTVELLSAPFAKSTTVGYSCTSAFAQSSTTLTSDGRTIYENGVALGLDQTLEVAAGRPRHGYRVTALASTPTGLAAAVAPVRPNERGAQYAIIVINRERESSSIFRISGPSYDLAVSPDEGAFWYGAAKNHEFLQSLRPGGVPAGAPPVAASYAWSPDGRYLAVALHDQVKVFDRRTGATGTLAADDPVSLTWTR